MVLAGRQKLARGREMEAFTRRRETHAQRRRESWQAYQISFTVLFTCILLVLVYWRCVDPRGCDTGSIQFLILRLDKNNHGCLPQFACIFMCSRYYSIQDLADKISTYLVNQSVLKR